MFSKFAEPSLSLLNQVGHDYNLDVKKKTLASEKVSFTSLFEKDDNPGLISLKNALKDDKRGT